MNEAKVVYVLCHLREKFGNPAPCLAMLPELPERLHDALGRAGFLAGVGDVARVIETEHLAVFAGQQGLVFESIYMARTTLHKNVNGASRFRSEMRYLRRKRTQGGRSLASCERSHSEIAKSAASRLQCLASGNRLRRKRE